MSLLDIQLERTPTVLLPYQQVWCADTSPVKVCEKSRRIGLSWAEAADTALLCASNSGMNAWYIGYNKDMAQEFINDCANWAKFYGLAAGEISEEIEVFKNGDEEKSILTYVIRFASGFKITALSSRPSNLRGKQGRVIIDEAAFHDDLDELLKAAFALLIWGGQVHIISTHNGVDNPFNELINDILAKKKPYSLHHITFNDAVEQGLYERICLRTKQIYSLESQTQWVLEIRAFYGDSAEEELDCIPKNSGGAWLSRALIESRMSTETPVIRWYKEDAFSLFPEPKRAIEAKEFCEQTLKPLLDKLPENARSFFGEDFGRTGDLTVLWPLLEMQPLTYKVPFVVELRKIPYKQQEQIVLYIMRRLPRLTGAAFDAKGNGNYLSECAVDEFGSSVVECVQLSEKWYRENTAPFKAALEDGELDEIPKDADILADLRAFQVVKGVPRIPDIRTTGQDGEKRHGDSGIAAILAQYASRELNNGPVVVHSRRTRDSVKITQGY